MNKTTSEESEEKTYRTHSACLRIFGNIPDLDEITQRLGVVPSYSHRQGNRRGPKSQPYPHDMWSYTVPIDNTKPLHVHIEALWGTFRERKEYLLRLKHDLTVDVFATYSSNCDQGGLDFPAQSLQIFTELQIPLGISIIVL